MMVWRDLFNRAALRRSGAIKQIAPHSSPHLFFNNHKPAAKLSRRRRGVEAASGVDSVSVAGDAGDRVLVSLWFLEGLELHERRRLRRRLFEDVLAIELRHA